MQTGVNKLMKIWDVRASGQKIVGLGLNALGLTFTVLGSGSRVSVLRSGS